MKGRALIITGISTILFSIIGCGSLLYFFGTPLLVDPSKEAEHTLSHGDNATLKTGEWEIWLENDYGDFEEVEITLLDSKNASANIYKNENDKVKLADDEYVKYGETTIKDGGAYHILASENITIYITQPLEVEHNFVTLCNGCGISLFLGIIGLVLIYAGVSKKLKEGKKKRGRDRFQLWAEMIIVSFIGLPILLLGLAIALMGENDGDIYWGIGLISIGFGIMLFRILKARNSFRDISKGIPYRDERSRDVFRKSATAALIIYIFVEILVSLVVFVPFFRLFYWSGWRIFVILVILGLCWLYYNRWGDRS